MCSLESLTLELADSAWSASSYLPGRPPHAARMFDISQFSRTKQTGGEGTGKADAWVAGEEGAAQHLQLDLGREVVVAGLELSGSPALAAYTTAFNVLYSRDDHIFWFIEQDGAPKVFRGSFDPGTPVEVMFPNPVEGRFIRILPKNWVNQIAMQLDLLGCPELSTSPAVTTSSQSNILLTAAGWVWEVEQSLEPHHSSMETLSLTSIFSQVSRQTTSNISLETSDITVL